MTYTWWSGFLHVNLKLLTNNICRFEKGFYGAFALTCALSMLMLDFCVHFVYCLVYKM